MNRAEFKEIHATDVRGTTLDTDGFPEEDVRRSVLQILDSTLLCAMATVTPEGGAHINTACFSYSDKLDLYFLSHPDSLHCRNLLNNPSMAVAVFSTLEKWTDPGQGVQLFGTCQPASDSSAEEAERSYRRRFEAYENWKATRKEDDLARQYRFYRLDIASIKILDEKNLGDAVFVRASVLRQ